jgi:hypothetical protein
LASAGSRLKSAVSFFAMSKGEVISGFQLWAVYSEMV